MLSSGSGYIWLRTTTFMSAKNGYPLLLLFYSHVLIFFIGHRFQKMVHCCWTHFEKETNLIIKGHYLCVELNKRSKRFSSHYFFRTLISTQRNITFVCYMFVCFLNMRQWKFKGTQDPAKDPSLTEKLMFTIFLKDGTSY